MKHPDKLLSEIMVVVKKYLAPLPPVDAHSNGYERVKVAVKSLVAKQMEAQRDELDKVLADMQMDSLAYCTGYHVAIQQVRTALTAVVKRMKASDDSRAQLSASIAVGVLTSVLELVPPPNPDDHGFGKPPQSAQDAVALFDESGIDRD